VITYALHLARRDDELLLDDLEVRPIQLPAAVLVPALAAR
jgi:hypothetical protein